MESNKRDIYFEGRIYVGTSDDFPIPHYENTYKNYPVHGEHKWGDFEDVTGLYELKYEHWCKNEMTLHGVDTKVVDTTPEQYEKNTHCPYCYLKSFAIATPTPLPVNKPSKSYEVYSKEFSQIIKTDYPINAIVEFHKKYPDAEIIGLQDVECRITKPNETDYVLDNGLGTQTVYGKSDDKEGVKEKAKELWQKFGIYISPRFSEEQKLMQKEKQRRLVLGVIDEILYEISHNVKSDWLNVRTDKTDFITFWQQVRHQIQSM